MGSFSVVHYIILIVILAVYIVPLWRIVSKAGYPGAFSLLGLVPLVNIALLWVFAFSKWPVENK